MCMAKDAAMVMVNNAIAMAKEKDDPRYFLTAIRLHKMLYLAQGYMLTVHGVTLFEDEIEAHRCGPYVSTVQFVAVEKGFDAIREPFNRNEYVDLSFRRAAAINTVIERYGSCDLGKLAYVTMNTEPYLRVKQSITDNNKPLIDKDDMKHMSLFEGDKKVIEQGSVFF